MSKQLIDIMELQLAQEDFVIAFDKAYNYRESAVHDGCRSISEENWSEYIDSLENPVDKELVQKVKEHTMYVSYSELLVKLHVAFDKFVKKIGDEPFYVFLPKNFASETLLTIELWSRIQKLNFQGFVTSGDKLTESTNIVIIDDACYSGINVYSIMDDISYDNRNVEFQFFIVVPYISRSALKQLFQPFGIGQVVVIKIYHAKLTRRIEELDLDVLYNRFRLETSPVPLYFDHKIGNTFATFATVYWGYNPSKESSRGCLLDFVPDEHLKTRVWEAHFKELLERPSQFDGVAF